MFWLKYLPTESYFENKRGNLDVNKLDDLEQTKLLQSSDNIRRMS